MMKIKELREIGQKMGREGLSIAAIDLINNFDGSYKSAIQLCGQLSVIAKACTFDDYWQSWSAPNEQRTKTPANTNRALSARSLASNETAPHPDD